MHTELTPGRERALLFTLAGIQFTHVVDFMIMMPLGPQLTALFQITDAQELMAEVTLSVRLVGADGKVIERSVIEGRAPPASTEPEPAVAAMNAAFAMAMEALLNWCKGALPVK